MSTDTGPQASSHRETWDLIPWVVNGTASPTERARVEQHLRSCADCRDEFAFQDRVHAGMNAEAAPACDARYGLERLLARIDGARDGEVVPDAGPKPHRRRGGMSVAATLRSGWLRHRSRILAVAVVAQSIALAVLGAWLIALPRQPDVGALYRTLSQAVEPAGAATIRFVPAPDLTVGELQAILADAGMRIVESNRGSSIYGLAPEPAGDPANGHADARGARAAKTAAALARLRHERGVLLAEPVVSDTLR